MVGGYYGFLSSLVSSISPQYSSALDKALGAALSNLVVDTSKTAETVSKLMKEKG